MTSKRLSRQLKKSFSCDNAGETLASFKEALSREVTSEEREAIAQWFQGFPEFLESVDRAYSDLDDKANMAQKNIEVSSLELTEANSSLVHLNQTIAAMLDSLGQAFLLFDKDGICQTTFSRACVDILEVQPAGLPVVDVLRIPAAKRGAFDRWRNLLFKGGHQFEDLIDLAPKTFSATDPNKWIGLEFKPVRDGGGILNYVVVVATDRTAEVLAKANAHRMHAFATLVTNLLRNKRAFKNFMTTCSNYFLTMRETLDSDELRIEDLNRLKMWLHTLKGGSASFGLVQLSDYIHDVEHRLQAVSSLVEAHSQLDSAVEQMRALLGELRDEHPGLFAMLDDNKGQIRELSLGDLRQFYMGLTEGTIENPATEFKDRFLALPAHVVFRHFGHGLMEDARTLGKELRPLELEGDKDLRLLPEMYEGFLDSLVHIFRNIADHAIETPEARVAKGKNRAGVVRMRVERLAPPSGQPQIQIQIRDDGAGIEPDALPRIFDSGFSTAKRVTTMSGRGVGLSAVKQEVERLGGQIDVDSKVDIGTTFSITLPLFDDAFAASDDAERAS